MFSILRAVGDVGDEVLVPEPGWPGNVDAAVSAEMVAVGYPLRPDGTVDLAELERRVGRRTRAVVFTNPSNPLGQVVAAGELRRLAEWPSGAGCGWWWTRSSGCWPARALARRPRWGCPT